MNIAWAGHSVWAVVLSLALVVDYVVRRLIGAVHLAVTKFLLPFEKRRTSPELMRRYWADFEIGGLDALGNDPAVLSLLREPQDLAPLLTQLNRGLSRNRAFVQLIGAIGEFDSRESRGSQEVAIELASSGLNYLLLLNTLTLQLERNRDALGALLGGRMADVILREIPYENFFEEAKCKGVYWGVHLYTAAAGEAGCRESLSRLLHANILMAVVSEGLGPRCAGAGDDNASCGYLLAEGVATDGLDAISPEWRDIYQSWNAAYIANSACPNMDSAKIAASGLLLPGLINARSGDEWLQRRAISLLLIFLSTVHPDSSLNVLTGSSDSVPFATQCLKTWGQANRDAAHEAGLAMLHERVATLSEMTRVTRQARAMQSFLEALRSYDSEVGKTLEERRVCAVELAAAWRDIANL